MTKKKFEPNKWLKFEINGVTFIGRSLDSNNEEQLVSTIDSAGNHKIMEWSMIEETATMLTKLCFIASNDDKLINQMKPLNITKVNKYDVKFGRKKTIN